MSLAAGVRVGVYEIVDLIGSGGMGEVYRARDARLNRQVAIKVLPAAFSSDAERLRRFEQEARAAAALNHPNVLAVFDVGSHAGAPYVVSELLEGDTLRERLGAGPLPVRKAIEIGIHIAHGLAAAHARGIVHRDLKPENIFITGDGLTKILDFGLAKLVERDEVAGPSALATAPPHTADGIVLGTIGYMSPEQARGRAVDHRTDIFSFGAILYELLCGQRAFARETSADTLSAILKEDPADLPVAERHIPPALVRIVDHCLEKSQAARFQSANDLAFALEALSSGATQSQVAAVTPARSPVWHKWPIAVALIVGVGATLAVSRVLERPGEVVAPAVLRTSVVLPDGARVSPAIAPYGRFAISPDGTRLAIVAVGDNNRQMIWLRRLDDLSAYPLAGTEGGAYPFWSPDSRFIGFLADRKLKKVDVAGGSPSTLADAVFPSPGSWNKDDVIVFNGVGGNLFRMSANGGTPEPATKVDPATGDAGHALPFFLPDGQHFLYSTGSNTRGRAISVGSLNPQEQPIDLLPSAGNVMYAQGYLFFMRDTVLLAQPFDAARLTLSGQAVPIAEQVAVQGIDNRTFGAFSVSPGAVLVYQPSSVRFEARLNWYDRSGRALKVIGEQGNFAGISVSADGRRAAVMLPEPKASAVDVWIVDLERGVRSRLTAEEGDDQSPVWTPDGSRVIFGSRRASAAVDLVARSSSGRGDEEILGADAMVNVPTSVSPDGKHLLFSRRAVSPASVSDVWVMPLSGDRTPRALIASPGNDSDARFSPDGRWIAYQSNTSGRNEIWLTTFPEVSGRWLVSAAGGEAPRWAGSAKELFYADLDRRLMAVTVDTSAAVPVIGNATVLFPIPRIATRFPYDSAPDGQRVLVASFPRTENADLRPLTLLVNWPSLLDLAARH